MPNSDTTFEEFESRKDVYNKLWDALVDEDSPLIHGIYGMAGVGKTRMMEQLWEDAVKKTIFDKAVRVNVGNENTDIKKLQDQIAGRLDCKLETEVAESRASQLENSLSNGGKILLILDDVWTKIPLKDIIGAPFGEGSTSSKGSKILLTSRKKKVCLNNECEHVVEIETLSPNEALYLFEKTVGRDSINSLSDQSLVKEVCNKCGRLQLLIHAVGKALKGKPHYLWKDAHDQLKKGKFKEIPDVDPEVYPGIKLSIDYLQNDDAKSCLFLCSMFPEDANIDMKMLIQLATGSGLVPDGESRVLAMVDYLKISSLLLNSGEDDEPKVHDIIRSVARSVAFTDSKYAFLEVTCNSRYLPSNADYRTRKFLRLDVKTADVHFKEHLVCPDLHSLWLQSNKHPQQFSGGFFSMFANLSCLMLQKVKITLEQFSLQPLGNLGTLSLLESDITNTDARLFPKSLETLCICECQLPTPLDVANLKCLRKLEMKNGGRPVLVMENVISSLSGLEELHLTNGFVYDYDEYHLEPIVMEISELTGLKSLHFEFYEDEDNTFQDTDIFSNIERYNIIVGIDVKYTRRRDWEVPLTRSIYFEGNHSKYCEGFIARAEAVTLKYSDVEVSSICNGHTRAFEDLKRLFIDRCNTMRHVANISREEIQYSVQSPTCFSKLTDLEIRRCSKLKYLFCNDIAKGLGQLQKLIVTHCESMEAIILNQGTSDGDIINFSKLKSVEMLLLPRLRSFCAENSGCTSTQYQPLFYGMVAIPSLEKLVIQKASNTSVIWGKECCSDTVSSFGQLNQLYVWSCENLETVIPRGMLHRLHNLEHIDVSWCNSLRTVFPLSAASGLKHLKLLTVSYCEEMRNIMEAGEQTITDVILFPELTDLYLEELPKLKSFWGSLTRVTNTCKVRVTLPHLSWISLEDLPALKSFFHDANFEFDLPVTKKVTVRQCGLSIALFTRSTFKNLKQLEELSVCNCEFLEGFFEDAKIGETLDTGDKIITLNRVSSIHLEGLPKFKSIFFGASYKCYMSALKNVEIVGCGVSILFTCSMFQDFQELEELHISECESLEQIVEEAEGDETSQMNGKNIKSSKLSSITLESLPNLKSFSCTSSYVFNMPKLQNFTLINCPRIEYSSFSKINTSLVRVTSDWCFEEDFQDLNECIRQKHKRESCLSGCAGETSHSSHDMGTQSEIIEEEEPSGN